MDREKRKLYAFSVEDEIKFKTIENIGTQSFAILEKTTRLQKDSPRWQTSNKDFFFRKTTKCIFCTLNVIKSKQHSCNNYES
ncbi:unnamed protein product [Larinioides sclopetarius]|uniref:Uncharacterized protein n=1 Tax=Larinioides sclopetarius TaxID=280406 RepID=A0AAV2AK40_9ARAC